MTSLLSKTTPEGVYLEELGPNDVLLGRGTGPNENRGNVKFRGLLKKRIDEVCANDDGFTDPCNSRHIAIDVMDIMQSAGGHFVRKLTPDEIKNCSTKLGRPYRYVVVEDTLAREKTKQSIRFQIRSIEKAKNSESTGGGGERHYYKEHHNTKSKSALAISDAKKRRHSSGQPQLPLGPHEARGPSSLVSNEASSLKLGITGERHFGAPIIGTGQLVAPSDRRSLYPQGGSTGEPVVNLPPLPTSLPGNSLLYSSGASSSPFHTSPPPTMALMLTAERRAYARLLDYEQQLQQEDMRMRLMVARSTAGACGYYPPLDYLALNNPLCYSTAMMHGTTNNPDMPPCVGGDPLSYYSSNHVLPNNVTRENSAAVPSSAVSLSIVVPTNVPSATQPVPGAPTSS